MNHKFKCENLWDYSINNLYFKDSESKFYEKNKQLFKENEVKFLNLGGIPKVVFQPGPPEKYPFYK